MKRRPPSSPHPRDTKLRTIVKALTWQLLGLVVTGLIAWFHTGSVAGALTFALSTSATGLAFFVVHERIWAQISWGLGETSADARS